MRRIARLSSEAEERQWNQESVRATAESRLEEVLAAASQTPYYGRALATIEPDTPFVVLEEVTILPRHARREGTGRFLTPEPGRVRPNATSGTGGVVTQVAKPLSSVVHRGAVERRWFSGLGLPEFMALTNVTQWPGQGRQLPTFHDWRVSYRDLGISELVALWQRERKAGDLILSAPDVLHRLATKGPRWHAAIAVASTFEFLEPATRRFLAEAGSPPLAEMYCAAEISAPIAFAYPGCVGLHVNADYVHVEVVGEDNRPRTHPEPGRVIVTDLLNTAMPILRYEIGDLGTLANPSSCPCGRQLPVLHLLGRHMGATPRASSHTSLGALLATIRSQIRAPFLVVRKDHGILEIVCDVEPELGPISSQVSGADVIQLRWQSPDQLLTPLMSPNGFIIDRATRDPIDRFFNGPPRWEVHPRHQNFGGLVKEQPGQLKTEAQLVAERRSSTKSAMRRLLRQQATTSVVRVLDSRSMVPFFRREQEATVRWGIPSEESAVGRIVLVELQHALLVVHRIARSKRDADGLWFLQVSDSYRMGDSTAGYWVEASDVLGTVVAIRRPGSRFAIHLTSRRARVAQRVLAHASYATWCCDRLRLRVIVAPLMLGVQRLILSFAYAYVCSTSRRVTR
jgi:phenylacetate-CoA ligase